MLYFRSGSIKTPERFLKPSTLTDLIITAQLSLAGDKLWMKVDDLYISEYVIDEVCEGVGGFGTYHSDAAYKRSVHCSLNESEDALNSASCLGLGAVGNCSGLISIKVSWSRPLSIPTKTFEYIDKTNCILYVPKGTSTLYKSASVWENFQNIQEYADD